LLSERLQYDRIERCAKTPASTTYLAIPHALPRHERDDKDGDGGDPSKDAKTDRKHLEGRAWHDKGRCSRRRRRGGRRLCDKGWSDAPGTERSVDTYGGQGAILDLLDLLTDRGEGQDAGLDHGAIGTARGQRRACYGVREADSRLNGVGGCNGCGRREGCGYSDRGNLAKGEIRRRERRHDTREDEGETEKGNEGKVHCDVEENETKSQLLR
jgi:hypothetical protein